jgi:hypothetical protein
MRTLASAAVLLALAATPLLANDPPALCPCVPISHLWVVKTCYDWTCAATELAVAGGDPQVIAMPVGMNDTRWLIVRRLAAGTAIDTSNDPFNLEQFDAVNDAVQRFAKIDQDHRPMLMTAPDGRVLVIALRQPEPKRRAVVH